MGIIDAEYVRGVLEQDPDSAIFTEEQQDWIVDHAFNSAEVQNLDASDEVSDADWDIISNAVDAAMILHIRQNSGKL